MRTFKGRRVLVAAALAVALMGAGAGVAFATSSIRFGVSVERVTIVTNDTPLNLTSESWTNVAGFQIFAEAGWHILVQFSGESTVAGTPGGWASVRVLVDGVEADPASGIDFAFDHVESTSSWEAHSMQRVRTVSTLTSHAILVQAAMSNTGITMRLDDYTATAWAIDPTL